MTPKEKAKELVDKMKLATDEFGYININKERHKQCALIAVDELISIKLLWFQKDTKELDYWNEVKKQIEKL